MGIISKKHKKNLQLRKGDTIVLPSHHTLRARGVCSRIPLFRVLWQSFHHKFTVYYTIFFANFRTINDVFEHFRCSRDFENAELVFSRSPESKSYKMGF